MVVVDDFPDIHVLSHARNVTNATQMIGTIDFKFYERFNERTSKDFEGTSFAGRCARCWSSIFR